MSVKYSKIIGLIVMFCSAGTHAATTTWDFTSVSMTTNSSTFGNTLFIDTDGDNTNPVDLSITAWADTDEVRRGSDKIENALAWRNSYGLLNYNRNRPRRSNEAHYVDNQYNTDMLLLTFKSSVRLKSIKLGAYSNDSDVSIAALDASAAGSLIGNTWQGIANNVSFSDSFNNVGTNYYTFASTSAQYSRYWLIGAYNSVFGRLHDGHSDFLKIAAIKTHAKPTEVSEPGLIVLMSGLLGWILMSARRKQQR